MITTTFKLPSAFDQSILVKPNYTNLRNIVVGWVVFVLLAIFIPVLLGVVPGSGYGGAIGAILGIVGTNMVMNSYRNARSQADKTNRKEQDKFLNEVVLPVLRSDSRFADLQYEDVYRLVIDGTDEFSDKVYAEGELTWYTFTLKEDKVTVVEALDSERVAA